MEASLSIQKCPGVLKVMIGVHNGKPHHLGNLYLSFFEGVLKQIQDLVNGVRSAKEKF